MPSLPSVATRPLCKCFICWFFGKYWCRFFFRYLQKHFCMEACEGNTASLLGQSWWWITSHPHCSSLCSGLSLLAWQRVFITLSNKKCTISSSLAWKQCLLCWWVYSAPLKSLRETYECWVQSLLSPLPTVSLVCLINTWPCCQRSSHS